MRIVLGLLVFCATITHAQRGPTAAFPHERHQRLFPLCESCHRGIATGDAATSMPTEASCRECHNGTDVRAVTWRREAKGPGLLRYSHVTHASQVDSAGRACTTCHGTSGQPRMVVQRAAPPTCLTCHTHRATAHLADDNRCATCHVPLTAATGISAERIAALPRPASHERTNFVIAHAPATPLASATCATCHARESCSRCHVNASAQPLIASLGHDVRVARLVAGRAPAYPLPDDHRAEGFASTHGKAATTNITRCGACHARPACTSCHIGTGAAQAIAVMPLPEPGGAHGVLLRLQPPRARQSVPMLLRADTTPPPPRRVRVHDAAFRTEHKAAASTGSLSCAGCHERKFCSDCHATEVPRRFHKANFAQDHAADSYGRQNECASCHNAELFCRSCHRESGLASSGRLDVAFHTAQPQWLLQHGRAARQGLQNCTTCHVQRDCMRCHSTLGWGVNPHGPNYPANRLAGKQPTQCLMCHLRIPGR